MIIEQFITQIWFQLCANNLQKINGLDITITVHKLYNQTMPVFFSFIFSATVSLKKKLDWSVRHDR